MQREDTVTDDGRRAVMEFTVFGWNGRYGKILSPIMQGWPVMIRTQELLQCISLFDEDIAVSNIQNKGENKR